MKHIVLLSIIVIVYSEKYINILGDNPPNFTELAANYGHQALEYDVITEDGYILRLFRIKGEREMPVLLMHGILDSADTWVLRGNESLAITLANKDYDVWLGNCRGNKYGRRHIYLDPDNNTFWDYTFHEHGYYDLPATIDNILFITNASKLNAIGHSQGTTIFYVLGSTRHEYNNKINVLIALAPVCFLENMEPPLKTMIQYSPMIYLTANMLDIKEIFGTNQNVINTICQQPIINSICVTNTIFPITGEDSDELEDIPILYEHFPTATSVKNLYHFSQVSYKRQFANFDYGVKLNLDKYGSPTPSVYQLDKITMKISLFVGINDNISTLDNVAMLKQSLPNVINYMIIPHTKMNHIDFVWGLPISTA
ncbi:PREDICTED: lipase 1-like [Papilio xuthus]|uniref:Lipase n=1 Tax=Papilio xuthus TaxID=66420 RepID=A0AAJ7E5S7_PAPXU|nr:PREDICTED: lipase 1-like [Papilio xuthus]